MGCQRHAPTALPPGMIRHLLFRGPPTALVGARARGVPEAKFHEPNGKPVPLDFIQYHTVHAYGTAGAYLHAFTSAPDGCEQSTSCPGRFTSATVTRPYK